MRQQSLVATQEDNQVVGWTAVWTVGVASLVTAALFAGVAGAGIVLVGLALVALASHHVGG